MDVEDVFRLKVRLLTEGAILPKSEWGGRKGGAGPIGGRYYFLPNGRACGIPIRHDRLAKRYHSSTLEPTYDPSIWKYDDSIELRTVPTPEFYDLVTHDGIPYNKIALLHGSDTLATTVYQSCKYWADGTQCKFCTVPLSEQSGATILEKTPDQIAEVVKEAEREGIIHDLLLTTGTPDSSDMGCNRIVRIIERVREESNIPIAVQYEPSSNLELIDELASAGANAVAMHIESLDDEVRRKICPGKYHSGSYELHMKNWEYAIDFFGRGNVSTFILHGLGENMTTTIERSKEIAELGAMPIVAPVRPSINSQLGTFTPSYVGNLEDSMQFYKTIGKILYTLHLNPKKTIAGCHRCGGCTPIQEAYDWAEKYG